MVGFNVDNDIAFLTLNNGKANAFGHEQIDAVIEGLDRAKAEAKAVVLAGTPGMFSAGYDLNEVKKGKEAVAALLDGGSRLMLRMLDHPQPVVAACTGHAVALGALILLACDTRVGADGAFKIGLNETRIGLPLPVFAFELTRARIAKARQRNVILEAQMYDPQRAAALGFLDEVVEPDRLMSRASEVASQLGQYPAEIYARHKAEILAEPTQAIRSSIES